MPHPFSDKSAEPILKSISELFSESSILLKKTHFFIFLCGGDISPDSKSARKKFKNYAESNLENRFRFIMAEDVSKDLIAENPKTFFNLAHFEGAMGKASDCILIFLESPGSIAEVGYFSKSEELKKKCLLVMDLKHQGESFIKLGPAELIGRDSEFRPNIFINIPVKPKQFSPIKEMLERRMPEVHRANKLVFNSYKELSFQEKLFVVLKIIQILKVVTFEGLKFCMHKIFEKVDYKNLKQLTSLLVSAGYIKKKDDYISALGHSFDFIKFVKGDLLKIETEIVSLYMRKKPEAYNMISRFINAN